jgi:ferredoxin-NADP reductase
MELRGGPSGGLPVPRRYTLSLIDRHRESPTAMTFRFSTKGTGFSYLSNQAIRLALPGVDDPWGAARLFSLSSSPTEAGWIAVTCKISDTPFKQALARLAPGATADVYGPMGAFVLNTSRPAVFLAGGIGITPFRGMLRFARDTHLEQPLVLLYSARTPEELVFRSQLDEIAASAPNTSVHYTITRPDESRQAWAGRVGRIDAAWIREAVGDVPRPCYYVAGLPEMVAGTARLLGETLSVPEDDIDYEMFRGF